MFNYTKRKTVKYNRVSKIDPKTRHQMPTDETEAVATLEFDVSTHIDNVVDLEALVEQTEHEIREFVSSQDKANIIYYINDTKLRILVYGNETLKELQCKFKRSYSINNLDFIPNRVDL